MRERKHPTPPNWFQRILRVIFPWRYPDVYMMKPGDKFRLPNNPEHFRVNRNEDYLHCEVCNNIPTKGEFRRFGHEQLRWYVISV
jgi:hypothetical protein